MVMNGLLLFARKLPDLQGKAPPPKKKEEGLVLQWEVDGVNVEPLGPTGMIYSF